MSCAGLGCLRSHFASNSKPAHVISFINLPCLETLGKTVPTSFSHGTYFVDSIMVAVQKLKARCVFQENIAAPLNVRKFGCDAGANAFLSIKKGRRQMDILRQPQILLHRKWHDICHNNY